MADPALLDEVRQAAEAALEAHASGESTQEQDGRKLAAARAALDGGHPIAAIAEAEAEGEAAARDRVGAQVLRSIERLAKKMRDATQEYERAVTLGTRLGLAARDIAVRAGVSHGTVAAVARRHEQAEATPPVTAAREASDVEHAGEPAPQSGAG